MNIIKSMAVTHNLDPMTGFVGVLLAIFGAGYGIVWLIKRRKPTTTELIVIGAITFVCAILILWWVNNHTGLPYLFQTHF